MPVDRPPHDLESIFIENRTSLREAAQAIVGARDRAEDVTQSAYLRVLEVSDSIHVRQPLNYCFQVVRHLAIDFRRRMLLEAHYFVNESHGERVPAAASSPEQALIFREQLQMVESVLNELPERTRKAFSLYRLSGLTQRQIARQLGVSATMVNFMIRDAMTALMNCRQHAPQK